MARAYSRNPEPHRELKVDLKDPQRGEDIRALQAAGVRRLDARGIDRDVELDGIYGPDTADMLDTAAHFLGALRSTIEPDVFPIGAQRIVRYPGFRSASQLDRAQHRAEQLERQRAAAHKAHGSRDVVIREALQAFDLAYRHKGAVHYTMGGQRWQGIARGLKASKGQYPSQADCSSMFTWCYWQELGDGPDVVNGQSWDAGYTGTLLTHGERIRTPEPGCAVLYGRGWPGVHVAMYKGDGLCYSHGSEAGPFLINYRYRSDILELRRYV